MGGAWTPSQHHSIFSIKPPTTIPLSAHARNMKIDFVHLIFHVSRLSLYKGCGIRALTNSWSHVVRLYDCVAIEIQQSDQQRNWNRLYAVVNHRCIFVSNQIISHNSESGLVKKGEKSILKFCGFQKIFHHWNCKVILSVYCENQITTVFWWRSTIFRQKSFIFGSLSPPSEKFFDIVR